MAEHAPPLWIKWAKADWCGRLIGDVVAKESMAGRTLSAHFFDSVLGSGDHFVWLYCVNDIPYWQRVPLDLISTLP